MQKINSSLYTVILCCKNAEQTIRQSVKAIRNAGCRNLIIIDGFSDDGTRRILEEIGEVYFDGRGKGLAEDCQLGIDLSKTEYCFFVDADHIIPENFFREMFDALLSSNVNFIQSKLRVYRPKGVMNIGEDAYYRYIHNIHWDKKMIGTSPSLFRREDLMTGGIWQFVSPFSKSTGDTSWARRAHNRGARFAIVDPQVPQIHNPSFLSYIRKFVWYGFGDAEFILENPSRRCGMFFHLSVRYPIIYGLIMIRNANLPGLIFVTLQGLIRFKSCLKRLKYIKKSRPLFS